ncbi:hypothetical protein [Actinomadura oligospora]|uniref:aggregation-promoting factor C-terminal-like domain-containing protein n=1 Tax=Actinomadura oligospora TaxID=111804 RepID=UPI0004B57E6B|nr:hypothetical protein [Actinomadura oligospora]
MSTHRSTGPASTPDTASGFDTASASGAASGPDSASDLDLATAPGVAPGVAPGSGGRIRAAVRLAAVGAATALVATPLLATPVKTISSAAERATGAVLPTGPDRRPLLRRAADRHTPDRRDRRTRRLHRNKTMARALMNRFGWRSARQYRCLEHLWTHESHWNERAHSPSGAHGIPQALPGAKMSAAGPHWQSNAQTQIRWGLRYIRGRYGTPCTAWAHWQSAAWY